MLQPELYPDDLPKIRKHDFLQQQAKAVSLEEKFIPVQQTVAFHDKTNAAGVSLKASKMSAQDILRLNDGSKNTVLTTYLTDAWEFGAEMCVDSFLAGKRINRMSRYCGCNVRYIQKHPDEGYLVYFQDRASTLPFGSFGDKLRWVHARRLVFLGAGSIGSTEIVLRSQQAGLTTSSRVGQRLSGNGGSLSFNYDLGHSIGKVSSEESPGPAISGMFACRDDKDREKDFIVQDGVRTNVLSTAFG